MHKLIIKLLFGKEGEFMMAMLWAQIGKKTWFRLQRKSKILG